MSRHAICGRGRLLPMSGAATGATHASDGPWVLVLQRDRIIEVREGEPRRRGRHGVRA